MLYRLASLRFCCLPGHAVLSGVEVLPSAAQVEYGIARVEAALPRLSMLAQGGTGVGSLCEHALASESAASCSMHLVSARATEHQLCS